MFYFKGIADSNEHVSLLESIFLFSVDTSMDRCFIINVGRKLVFFSRTLYKLIEMHFAGMVHYILNLYISLL